MRRGVPLHGADHIDMARRAGRLAAEVLSIIEPYVVAGVSTQDGVCHGIPTSETILKDGDIINIDVAVIKDGWFGDTSRMYYVGTPSVLARRLVETTYQAMLAGIGQTYHGEPQVLHYGRRGQGLVLKPGMIFTIEPMLNAGRGDTRQLSDGWTVVTQDKSLSAQWEHMVVVTSEGYEVLTPWPDAADSSTGLLA